MIVRTEFLPPGLDIRLFKYSNHALKTIRIQLLEPPLFQHPRTLH